jgi:DNA-nicking Smr family endonuclease
VRFHRAPSGGRSGLKDPSQAPRLARSRRLTDDEIDLWIAVAKSVTRRKGATLPGARKVNPSAVVAPAAEAKTKRASAGPRAAAPPPLAPLERRVKRQLARGRSAIDQSIDLHGLNQAQAHQALRGFLSFAQSQGDRLVLVVTGKGAAETGGGASFLFEERGILRRSVPHWLHALDMRSIVLGFEEAGPAHGGSGALYVRLRRIERAARG